MRKDYKEIKLTPKLNDLYQLIKDRTEKKLRTEVKDIADALPEYYSVKLLKSNYSNCPTLYKDIDKINSCPNIEKIIIKDNNNFKLATRKEAIEYADRLSMRALRCFKKYYIVNNKIRNDGQGKLDIEENISDPNNPFVESFIKNDGVL